MWKIVGKCGVVMDEEGGLASLSADLVNASPEGSWDPPGEGVEEEQGGEQRLGENSRAKRFKQGREPPEETEKEEVRVGGVC